MTEAANRDQAEYWSGDSGQQWVTHQARLDKLMAPVLDRLLAEAKLQPAQFVLDIGCGTGASTLAIARAIGPKGHVTGADISEPLLSLARQRLDDAGAVQAECLLGDVQTLDFEPSRFDVALSRFGVMFFADPVAAFANISRALKPGGKIIFLAWSDLASNPWFRIPQECAMQVVGKIAPGDPRAPGPMAFQERDYVIDILKRAGLTQAAAEEINLDLTPEGDAAVIAEFATRVGPASRVIREREGTPDDTRRVQALVAMEIGRFETAAGIRVPATLNLFSANAAA